MATKKTEKRKTIIRRIEDDGDGHHGGAWKVAYADFVTAMMAFFLLMWIINFVPDETRMGLTSYFSSSPSGLVPETSGSGGFFGGDTNHLVPGFAANTGAPEIQRATPARVDAEDEGDGERAAPTAPGEDGAGGPQDARIEDGVPNLVTPQQAARAARAAQRALEALEAEEQRREDDAFTALAERMRRELEADPATADLGQRILFQIAPEGLRIHIPDTSERPMFDSASATPNPILRNALRALLPTLLAVPNEITITGHTDARPFRGTQRDNWDLSTERAVATQRFLVRNGLPERRIASVSGMADRQPLVTDNPNADANRRITLLLRRN